MSELPNERTVVELPFITQLKGMGWQHYEGDIDVPYLTERQSFREVLLKDNKVKRLQTALRKINLDDDGNEWLNEDRINQAVGALERLGVHKLMEANQALTDLLLNGYVVEGEGEGGRSNTVQFIDFDCPERNDFLAINQFRVDPPWAVGDKDFIVPDIVLFVNGIPLVVAECKSPARADVNPIEDAITQLLRYSNQRGSEMPEGAERLFHYNQITVATSYYDARAGTISAPYGHYIPWKDTSPVPTADVAKDLGVEELTSQQYLVAGMLRPSHLIDIVRNFTLFTQVSGKTTKIVTRYQQFRAVHRAIRRLQKGQTRAQHGEMDQRGGIVWHTQGSGKSLSMVFLVRKMRTLPDLRKFKVVAVTDRRDLEKQLRDTAKLTGETPRRATGTKKLKTLLQEEGADLIFAMIQKYQERKSDTEEEGPRETLKVPKKKEIFPILNEDESILVLVDEAHRSHSNDLHANLHRALPNCAMIGFTGTPIIRGAKKKTHEIFGDFIDIYTLRQSQEDGATVPIYYEGRTAPAEVAEGDSLEEKFEDLFADRTPEELEAIKRKYATTENVLEAEKLIAAKARDMLKHYVDIVLPNGMKAQLVATSRLACVRYHSALVEAHKELLAQLEKLDPAPLKLSNEELEKKDEETKFLVRAHAHMEKIRRLEFAVVISGKQNDKEIFKEWTDKGRQDARIERFKKPLIHKEPNQQDGLAFLIVKYMLLTGFDAPVEQVLYVDRRTRDHELLQAIARVNRLYGKKKIGLVVDYIGLANHLKEALAAYDDEDIQGALLNLKDELPKLEDRHRRVQGIFRENGIEDISDIDACVFLLRDPKIRADFVVKLKEFLASVDTVMPRPEALKYYYNAKILGFINQAAANRYRDTQFNLVGVGEKVRQLIDKHIEAKDVTLKIGPVDIFDQNFEASVDRHISDRAKASEMEHALRHHIRLKFGEDPAYYKKLSERLEEILKRFEDNWAELVRVLREFTREVRGGRPADKTGLDPSTQAPFLGILLEEVGDPKDLSKEELDRIAGLTIDMVEHIRQEIRAVDFWRNIQKQTVLRKSIVQLLDEKNILPFERLQAIADRIVELAKALHQRLTT